MDKEEWIHTFWNSGSCSDWPGFVIDCTESRHIYISDSSPQQIK